MLLRLEQVFTVLKSEGSDMAVEEITSIKTRIGFSHDSKQLQLYPFICLTKMCTSDIDLSLIN